MTRQVEFAQFTPREAERITGVSTSLQRDWRRRKVLPPGKGHARFNVLELSWLLGTKLLSNKGVGPEHSKDVMDILAAGITQFALQNNQAFEGNVPQIQYLPTDEDTLLQIAQLEEQISQSEHPTEEAMLMAWSKRYWATWNCPKCNEATKWMERNWSSCDYAIFRLVCRWKPYLALLSN